jgi:hypothetical protein
MGKGGKAHAGPGEPGGEVVERFHRQEAGISLKIEHPVFMNSFLQSRGKSRKRMMHRDRRKGNKGKGKCGFLLLLL